MRCILGWTLVSCLPFVACAIDPAQPDADCNSAKCDNAAQTPLSSEHFDAVIACDQEGAAATERARAFGSDDDIDHAMRMWRNCIYDANTASQDTLRPQLRDLHQYPYNDPQLILDEIHVAGNVCDDITIAHTRGITAILHRVGECRLDYLHTVALLIDGFVRFGDAEKLALPDRRWQFTACYRRYDDRLRDAPENFSEASVELTSCAAAELMDEAAQVSIRALENDPSWHNTPATTIATFHHYVQTLYQFCGMLSMADPSDDDLQTRCDMQGLGRVLEQMK